MNTIALILITALLSGTSIATDKNQKTFKTNYDGVYTWSSDEIDMEETLIINGSQDTPSVLLDHQYSACSYSEFVLNIKFGKDGLRSDGEIKSGKVTKYKSRPGIRTPDGRFWKKDPVRSDSAKALLNGFLLGKKEVEEFYEEFRSALAAGDTAKVVDMCQFPITYWGGIVDDAWELEEFSRKDFLRYFNQIFSPDNRETLLGSKVNRRVGESGFFVNVNENSLLWFWKVDGQYKLYRMGGCPG